MKTKIFHSVNEGLYLENQGISILTDGIHDGITVGQSNMPSDLETELKTGAGIFGNLDCLLFTHLHTDHFSHEKVAAYLEKRKVALYGPGLESSSLPFHQIDDDVALCQFHHIKIWRIKTIHDGERFACVPHVTYILEMGKEVFIIGGDGILTGKTADRIMCLLDSQVTAIFVNVFQLLAEEKSGFIRSIMPEKVFLYHMPFPEDDINNMKYIKKSALRSYAGDLPEITDLVHMSWLDSLQPVKIRSYVNNFTKARTASGV